MQIGLAFYIIMLLWLVFGLWSGWPAPGVPANYRPLGGTLLLFILLLLLGWQIFGPPLQSNPAPPPVVIRRA